MPLNAHDSNAFYQLFTDLASGTLEHVTDPVRCAEFVADQVRVTYSHVDRMVVFGCMPVRETVALNKDIDVWGSFGTNFILERRELGLFNVGGCGRVTVDGTVYELGYKDCLYITMGAENVVFETADPKAPA